MTFYQARAISKENKMHVRRASWAADKWFMIWRGTWACFEGGNPPHPVRATDYGPDELLATDWTTMPAALASCPIDPAIGSTGGSDPVPGTPGTPGGSRGFPDDDTPAIRGGPGLPAGGTATTLPPPAPGKGITVTFAGILQASDVAEYFEHIRLNRTVHFPADGGTVEFFSGNALGEPPDTIQWQCIAGRTGSLWHITLAEIPYGNPSGGFASAIDKPAGKAADNFQTDAGFYGGKATVSAG